MDIPSFPPQDLAKLVLGYLAEEELMTAYDEFLQASPYLDAYKNEYDRILMTSLRSILADYRAVKIYVETCKPQSLRKKLLQCYNVLEMVKYLITVVDHQKFQSLDMTDRSSFSIKSTAMPRLSCNACVTMNLKSCVCKNKIIATENSQLCFEERDLHTSTEATPLADLPGNTLPTKRVLPEKETKKITNLEQSNCNLTCNSLIITESVNESLHVNLHQNNQPTKAVSDSRQKIEEFNTILNLVCNKNVTNEKLCDNLVSNKVSNATAFQNFNSGIQESSRDKVMRVPDSSTTDLVFVPIEPKPNEPVKNTHTKLTPKLGSDAKRADTDKKIKILSDVKFDNRYTYGTTAPPVLKGSTPKSVSNTKRLIINGTPGFTQKGVVKKSNFSKDEIMAMPTLIILPTSGSTHNLVVNDFKEANQNSAAITTTAMSKCEPLFVDVSSSMPSLAITDDPVVNENETKCTKTSNEIGLIKTIDLTHASLPKDTISYKTSTPHALPPIRKSSSTPRRTSHIRVLDFNTPRRILDTALEKDSNDDDAVVVISDSPVAPKCTVVENLPEVDSNVKNVNTEKKIARKPDWDEELRALVATNQDLFPPSPLKSVKKNKRTKKKIDGNKVDIDKSDVKNKSLKAKKTKKKKDKMCKPESIKLQIKPMIKIVSAVNSSCHSEPESDQCLKQPEDNFDTPENERLSLQNEIGAKLNISDLLETPYKQAMYDIQMETPKFLGPDLPGEPMSDIKIMNIPTPRFFDTTKPAQATPSSYSSRPTDYSSGGSYYKPDDQDYPIPDISEHKTDEPQNIQESVTSDTKKDTDVKSSTRSRRPTRKCTKNVSYYNSPSVKKPVKEVSSDVTPDEVKPIPVKPENCVEKRVRPSKSKKSLDKYKSPFKRDATKNFMKIKPRRVTPIKGTKKRKSLIKEKHHAILASAVAVTKSRRKSSTPRKLHCGKVFHSSTSSNTSPDTVKSVCITRNNPIEENLLRWYDEVSANETTEKRETTKDGEDSLTKIKEYIESIKTKKIPTPDMNSTRNFHNDLVKRGLDVETARIIERDLLDTPPLQDRAVQSTSNEIILDNTENCPVRGEININENIVSNTKHTEMPDADEDIDDIEFSVTESNQESSNYLVYNFDEATFTPKDIVHLKDKFCMEVCIDDGVVLRLKATNFTESVNEEPTNTDDCNVEIDSAVTSILNIDNLYTPLKDRRAQCYEIFDSTLTSIDTPLKANSPLKHDNDSNFEIIEEENVNTKKRKRVQSGGPDDSVNLKKPKGDPQYLLNHASIQNIDIESVLSKLHGP